VPKTIDWCCQVIIFLNLERINYSIPIVIQGWQAGSHNQPGNCAHCFSTAAAISCSCSSTSCWSDCPHLVHAHQVSTWSLSFSFIKPRGWEWDVKYLGLDIYCTFLAQNISSQQNLPPKRFLWPQWHALKSEEAAFWVVNMRPRIKFHRCHWDRGGKLNPRCHWEGTVLCASQHAQWLEY
jgi:hypothetical protein